MIKNNNIFWCKNCLNTSTRPRIKFNEHNVCNACVWAEEKKKIDWNERQKFFDTIVKKIKKKNKSDFDVIVPVSGGKDGSYVTYQCIKRGLRVLNVTVNPPLRTELGYQNLENFKKNDVNLFEINLPYESHRKINKYSFINHGRPLYGWLIGIFSSIFKLALRYKIPMIMYGEEGETEYGGNDLQKKKLKFDKTYLKNLIFSGVYEETISRAKISKDDLHFWEIGKNNRNLYLCHWSYFENWDSYRNYVIAKEHFNYKEKSGKNYGTYTNFSQNDTILYDLHCYLMFLKFGFGRATQDIGIDIRRGSLSRSQGVRLAQIYDNEFPAEYLKDYLDYFQISKGDFYKILYKHVNKKLFNINKSGEIVPNFELK